MDIFTIKELLEIILSSAAVLGLLYTVWRYTKKLIINPITKLYTKIDNLDSYFSKMDSAIENLKKVDKVEEVVHTLSIEVNNEILPVIKSLSKEFSKNSGKSIMDRILRIDDNTRLAELRSKLIASNLISTGIMEFNKNGELVWANKAFLEMCGLGLDTLQANGWLVCIDENSRERVWQLWQNSLKFNIPFESEFILKNQETNKEYYIKCTIFPHNSVDNIRLGYHGSVVVI